MYRYVGSGLPDVFLANGYEFVVTPYGKGVTIHNLEKLHEALAAAIVASPAQLIGSEFRFLRQQLQLSQAGLAELLGCDEQSVARWEKGKSKKVDPSAERVLRVLCQQSRRKLKPVLEMLKNLECVPPQPRRFVAKESGRKWGATAEAL